MSLETLLVSLKGGKSDTPAAPDISSGVSENTVQTGPCTSVTCVSPKPPIFKNRHDWPSIGNQAATETGRDHRNNDSNVRRAGHDELRRNSWLVHYTNREPVYVSCYPAATRVELLNERPDAVDVTQV